MIVTHYQYAAESMLENKSFEEGALYFIQDTQSIYFDPVGGTERIRVANDVNILATEVDRNNLLSPIPGKMYFVLSTCKSYVYFNGSWYAGVNETYVNTAIQNSETSMKEYIDQKIEDVPTLQEHFSTERMVLSNLQYGTELPSDGVEGQVFFKIIT